MAPADVPYLLLVVPSGTLLAIVGLLVYRLRRNRREKVPETKPSAGGPRVLTPPADRDRGNLASRDPHDPKEETRRE